MFDIIAKVLKFCAVHLTCTLVGGVIAGNFPLATTIPSLLLPLLMWGLGVLAAKRHRGAPIWIKTDKQMLVMIMVAVVFGLYAGLTMTGM